ncbi:type II toxin-antitoxin system RelE/ParE family toxin [Mucilaginibacter glaciei]|uniref:Type II toxin-antitoxin system RelE/ParE family toxin n=1 Tax=Mucilaginibacter glaciei TaxID=2772109 RepID=A0A926S3R6_9SPHI|nr:type II toxin-antitoxin system RelE/ParE family toxin [Mucilaginibacter glaciei]MBD1394524.1 type II toxin-antitoxin system RelE/ParE family toxin [Mucilaginibacter glaciei]
MPTGLKVVLSKRAQKDFDDILNYIKKDFGSLHAINFKNLVIKFLDLIGVFPEMGSLEEHNTSMRAFVVHRRLKVFYRFDDNRLIVLRLFDTRQHPDQS